MRLSVGSGDDPTELALGQLHKAVAASKLSEDLTFNHQRMRTRQIDEYGSEIFIPGGLRCVVNCHGHGASIWLPALECIETGEGQQCSTAVLRLERDYGHLRLLIRSEPSNGFAQTSSGRHHRYQQSIATERGNCPEVGLWSGFSGRSGHQTACAGTRGPGVTRKWGGCQPTSLIHTSTSIPKCRGESGALPHRRPLSGVAHWVNACC